ncbi:hypothetical protein BKA65DRAFT_539907 [Rhexocercosporidium sp. MPI-PUGE-AT-0058]|nr:hypothetical protein BKA65DRAFT_539907 [Rhexocercosporidium sp. MPI-PUGE-AT-0058]
MASPGPELTLPQIQLREYAFETFIGSPDHHRILQVCATLEAEVFVLGSLRKGIHEDIIDLVLKGGLRDRPSGYQGEYGKLFFVAGNTMLNQLRESGIFARFMDLATQQGCIKTDPNASISMMLVRALDRRFEDYHRLACLARDDAIRETIGESLIVEIMHRLTLDTGHIPLIGEFGMLVLEKMRADELRTSKENNEYYLKIYNERRLPPIPYYEIPLSSVGCADYLSSTPGTSQPAPPVEFLPPPPSSPPLAAAEQPQPSVPEPESRPYRTLTIAGHGSFRHYKFPRSSVVAFVAVVGLFVSEAVTGVV